MVNIGYFKYIVMDKRNARHNKYFGCGEMKFADFMICSLKCVELEDIVLSWNEICWFYDLQFKIISLTTIFLC